MRSTSNSPWSRSSSSRATRCSIANRAALVTRPYGGCGVCGISGRQHANQRHHTPPVTRSIVPCRQRAMLDEEDRMQVALLTRFAATKKEPLAVLLGGSTPHSSPRVSVSRPCSLPSRIHRCPDLFDHRSAAQEIPRLRAFHRRAIRDPECSADSPGVNRQGSPSPGDSVPFATLLAVAAGVRSLCRCTASRSTFTRPRSASRFLSASWRPSIRA